MKFRKSTLQNPFCFFPEDSFTVVVINSVLSCDPLAVDEQAEV
jgi:hypothetical protein